MLVMMLVMVAVVRRMRGVCRSCKYIVVCEEKRGNGGRI